MDTCISHTYGISVFVCTHRHAHTNPKIPAYSPYSVLAPTRPHRLMSQKCFGGKLLIEFRMLDIIFISWINLNIYCSLYIIGLIG